MKTAEEWAGDYGVHYGDVDSEVAFIRAIQADAIRAAAEQAAKIKDQYRAMKHEGSAAIAGVIETRISNLLPKDTTE